MSTLLTAIAAFAMVAGTVAFVAVTIKSVEDGVWPLQCGATLRPHTRGSDLKRVVHPPLYGADVKPRDVTQVWECGRCKKAWSEGTCETATEYRERTLAEDEKKEAKERATKQHVTSALAALRRGIEHARTTMAAPLTQEAANKAAEDFQGLAARIQELLSKVEA